MSLIQRTHKTCTTIEVSEDKKHIAVFYKSDTLGTPMDKIAEFDISSVWDTIKDAVATVDVGPISNPGLFRRKGEAIAGLMYTNRLYGDQKCIKTLV